jgi:putative transposase
VGNCIRAFSQQKQIEIVEMNIQPDHVHVLAMIPPKVSVSDYCGMVKGRSAIRVFNKFKELKKRPYWGNHFWTEGYSSEFFIRLKAAKTHPKRFA